MRSTAVVPSPSASQRVGPVKTLGAPLLGYPYALGPGIAGFKIWFKGGTTLSKELAVIESLFPEGNQVRRGVESEIMDLPYRMGSVPSLRSST
jgi:hypothetical protein